MTRDLLNCPFCGNSPEIMLRGNEFTNSRSAEIKCRGCGVKMIVGAIRKSLDWANEMVTKKWNLRSK